MTLLTRPVPADRSKIDMQNAGHVRAWAKKLNVSQAALVKIVETVGNSAAEVRKELERSGDSLRQSSLEQQARDWLSARTDNRYRTDRGIPVVRRPRRAAKPIA